MSAADQQPSESHQTAHRSAWRGKRIAMEAEPFRSTVLGPRPVAGVHYLIRWLKPILRYTGTRGWGERNARAVRLVRCEVPVVGLPPALEGFQILHLTDLHLGTLPGLEDRAEQLLKDVSCDLAVLTGDYQTQGWPDSTEVGRRLAPLLAGIQSRHGLFGVLGNHDTHAMVPVLEGLGVRMLLNEQVTLDVGGAAITLTGVDDVNRFHTPVAEDTVQLPGAGLRLALVHTPDLASLAAEAGQQLYLSGHTHAGQISLPGGVPLLLALDTHRHLGKGLWRVGTMAGYTSAGLGVGRVPVRFNTRGEAALLRLVAASR